MNTESRNLRPFFFLFVGMIVWWFAPSAFRRVVYDAVFEFEAPAIVLSSRMHDIAKYWELRSRDKNDLIRAGRDTSRLVALQQFEISRTEAIRDENSRLEKLLALPSRPEYRSVSARVAQRRLGMWWQQIILRRGSADGVRPGCPVVSVGGIVGRVREVFRDVCVVELVSSPSFRISACLSSPEKIFGDKKIPVTYRGTGAHPFAAAQGCVPDIPAESVPASAAENAAEFWHSCGECDIVTSGLGGIFPAGLKLGTLTGTPKLSADGMFYEADVELPKNLASIEEVAILVPLSPDVLEMPHSQSER